MKVLILSCNTGGGHNSAARAVAEEIRRHGDQAEVLDYLCLAGKGVSRLVGDGYVQVVKKAPRIFGVVYQIGMLVSRLMKKSPVYYANGRMAKYLNAYLEEHPADAVVMPHLYPAETITYMKRKGMSLPLTVAVMTDYTCIPFWEETDCDYYVIPHEKLRKGIVRRGLPDEKLLAFGIPVSHACQLNMSKEEARQRLGLDDSKKYLLLAGGSMGASGLVRIAALLLGMLSEEEHLIIICGSNQKVEKHLRGKYENCREVTLVGYTKRMPMYLKACDVVFTKPGGLTSTEAAVVNVPIVHIKPIPGCETENRKFFCKYGMSISGKTSLGQAVHGIRLLHDKEKAGKMMEAQRKTIPADAAGKLYCFLKEKCADK